MARTHYQNGEAILTSACGCDDCTPCMINGILCHEQGCPSSWKDYPVPCFECGCDFWPESRGERICSDCLNPPEIDMDDIDDDEPEDEED